MEGVAIAPMGGATTIGHFLDLLSPHGHGYRLAGLCDAGEEGDFRRELERAGMGLHLTRADMESADSSSASPTWRKSSSVPSAPKPSSRSSTSRASSDPSASCKDSPFTATARSSRFSGVSWVLSRAGSGVRPIAGQALDLDRVRDGWTLSSITCDHVDLGLVARGSESSRMSMKKTLSRATPRNPIRAGVGRESAPTSPSLDPPTTRSSSERAHTKRAVHTGAWARSAKLGKNWSSSPSGAITTLTAVTPA